MDLSTAMANRGVWEEISMTVLSTLVAMSFHLLIHVALR